MPTNIFQAIESKTPVICTNIGGNIEILDNGKNGLLLNHNNINNSSKAILNYIDDYNLQNKHVINSKNFLTKNFKYDDFKEKILHVLSEISQKN